jgi:hypothetical protein
MSSPVVELAIVHFAEGWRILTGSRRWGRFDDCVDAEEAALRLRARARHDGRQVDILVQGTHGELRRLDIR